MSELRVSRALRDNEATLPAEGTHIYLTDTLESPHAEPPPDAVYSEAHAEQHRRALKVKSKVPVIVCLGNPPYDRHEADDSNKARTGGWVRWGDGGERTILRDFLDPATDAGHGVHVKNLYNLYVYFWRWALWKVFEQDAAEGPGIVSFISASSYLDGDASLGCANISVGSATRFGFSTLAARDAVRAKIAMSSRFRRQWPLPWRFVPGGGNR